MSVSAILKRLVISRPLPNLTRSSLIQTKCKIRLLSTRAPISAHDVLAQEEGKEFIAVFPDFVHDLINDLRKFDPIFTPHLIEKVLNYNLPGGKKFRGVTIVLAFKELADRSQLTAENVRLAQMIGWCIELLQASLIILDDVMDAGVTRRGQLCWYRVEGVGMAAANDALCMENAVYMMLKKYFSDKPYYFKLVELFREVTFITLAGQCRDELLGREHVTTFTMEQLKSLESHKTSYYTFYLPIAAIMHMCSIEDTQAFRQVESISQELGHFFQTQNDYWDCFVDPAITGKVGTDIEENKCTWLVVTCMEHATPNQLKILEDCYGKSDPAKTAKVKQLYEEIGIHALYSTYVEESYNQLKGNIDKLPAIIPKKLFYRILDKLYMKGNL